MNLLWFSIMIDCFDIYDRLLLCVQERLECVAARVGGTYSYVKGRIALEGQEKAKPIPGRVQINPVAVMIKSRGGWMWFGKKSNTYSEKDKQIDSASFIITLINVLINVTFKVKLCCGDRSTKSIITNCWSWSMKISEIKWVATSLVVIFYKHCISSSVHLARQITATNKCVPPPQGINLQITENVSAVW